MLNYLKMWYSYEELSRRLDKVFDFVFNEVYILCFYICDFLNSFC